MRRLRLLALAAFLAFAGVACAGMSRDAELGQRYAVTVVNEMPHPMIVSIDDGADTRLLGTVGADREERFILDGSLSTTITIIARDEEDTHTVRRTVVLQTGETVEVRLN